jgi:phosphoribosylamine--glycine ligase
MTGLRILVIGSGGREHTLAWALARPERVGQITVAPGNAGTEWPESTAPDGARQAACANAAIPVSDTPALIRFAQNHRIDLTVVGPEAPLAAGIVDAFQAVGLRVFGPAQAAARLEASKVFAKQFMQAHAIPTADFAVFDDYGAALAYVSSLDRPLVVKADGLAAGKGVMVCDTPAEAQAALKSMMVDRAFGDAGRQVLIEDRLSGWEVSVLAFADGRSFALMPYAADHKRALDGDQGPNTGGMGAYAPRPVDFPGFEQFVSERILRPVALGTAQQGTPYKGVLYIGLMMTADGPRVLEFNCRFGDPETQVILPLLGSDLAEVMLACAEGRLDPSSVRWQEGACATVVLASGGYPGEYRTGLPISGLSEAAALPGVHVFHAGTARVGADVVTAGGRVLTVSGLGQTLPRALEHAYAAARLIHFDGMHYRGDIGRTIREAV